MKVWYDRLSVPVLSVCSPTLDLFAALSFEKAEMSEADSIVMASFVAGCLIAHAQIQLFPGRQFIHTDFFIPIYINAKGLWAKRKPDGKRAAS